MAIIRWLDRYFEEVVAGSALVAMALLVFVQVIMRYVFQKALSWTDEVAIYCMVWSVYIASSWAVRERAHIRVMNLINAFPKAISQVLVYLSDAVWFIFAVFMTYQGILIDASLWRQKYESPALGIDQKWPYMIVAFGFGLMTLRLMQVYWRHIKYGESLLEPPGGATGGRLIHD
jgi:C4-dicarboxylate transporter DctQ subunit